MGLVDKPVGRVGRREMVLTSRVQGVDAGLEHTWRQLFLPHTKQAADEPTCAGLQGPEVSEKPEDVHFLLSD